MELLERLGVADATEGPAMNSAPIGNRDAVKTMISPKFQFFDLTVFGEFVFD